ncbi:glucokinase [uncultured Aliiroseovarius sp.]|uniref:glucokinase n=1 Tax=uncultured Aliiroseovarius sp. TaxID=1658783 RepID=UPI003436E72C
MRWSADIGGTKARLALCGNGEIFPQTVRCFANHGGVHFRDTLGAYLESQSRPRRTDLIIAVTGPVRDDHALLPKRKLDD